MSLGATETEKASSFDLVWSESESMPVAAPATPATAEAALAEDVATIATATTVIATTTTAPMIMAFLCFFTNFLVFFHFIILHFFQGFNGIPSVVAGCYPVFLGHFFDLFDQFLSSFLGELRDGDADNLAVVDRVEPQV